MEPSTSAAVAPVAQAYCEPVTSDRTAVIWLVSSARASVRSAVVTWRFRSAASCNTSWWPISVSR